jgi:hypothetical protein
MEAYRDIKATTERSGAAATPRRTRSLVRRLRGWTVAVFTSTLTVFTAAGILEERREILQTDAELEALAVAVKTLGPGLEQQVHQWVEAERRAAVALVSNDVRNRLRGPLREVRALAGDLSVRNLLVPAEKRKVRSLLADIDRVDEVLAAEECQSFGPRPPSAALPDRPESGQGASP